ncbi:hypothetical protein A8139_00920 [Marinomonas primoryensis]|uniref:GmrSD restriction endonucleases N-terminal domain-containing protein n=1 Tax=Marinomonas primoryensis TaxID=178399 RepID=A0A2Z4PX78_9GAMM|nr:hypothetical protein A8139_00920 [Marinomonas primoryensis]
MQIKGEIETFKESADGAIRKHQREVDYDSKEMTIEMVVDKYKDGLGTDENELFVPDYQRDFVWSERNQSRLIESLIIGLPIPHVFIADIQSDDPDLDGRVEIVDGSQRIRTLHAFLSDQLVLQGLQLIPQLNGFHFTDLPTSRQRRFNRISIRIIELSNCTEDTRRDLFERINTGSDELKDMEVRKGSKYGNSRLYSEVITVCADYQVFSEVVPLSAPKIKRGENLEFILRFFAYLNKYQNFDHSVREFLDSYLKAESEKTNEEIKEMISIFNRTMNFAKENLPFGFRKTQTAKTTPRVRFEALAVGIALALREKSDLNPDNISEWLFSEDFKALTTGDASNSKPRVVSRIEYVRDKLLGD